MPPAADSTPALANRRAGTAILVTVVVAWTVWGLAVALGYGDLPRDLVGWAAYLSLLLASVAELVALRRDARRAEQEATLRADQELLRAELRAEVTVQAELLARLSHEMRTPVHGILGMTELLLGGGVTGEQRRRTEILQACAEQLRALVDDALDLARLESGRLELREEAFSPRRLLAQTLASVAHQAEVKELELGCEVSGEVPETLRGDPLRLRQVWLNLLSNGLKFTREGRVDVRLRYADGHLMCEVEDTGVGISEADQERLFRSFERADTTVARSVDGAGLGLAICRHLVQEMDGTLACRSSRDRVGPGSGSTFHFRIPIEPAAEVGKPTVDAGREPTFLSGRRVLVVDDDPVHRLVVASHLEEVGAEVVGEAYGETALARAAAEGYDYDAVFVDVQIPGSSGPETIRALRQAWPAHAVRPAVLALTAEISAEVRARCLGAGADDILGKPFRREELLACLRASLPNGASREGLASDATDAVDFADDESVPSSLSGSETLAALWRHGRRTGRDEVTHAIDGLRDSGRKALSDLRAAERQQRHEDAATCAHALAGVAAVLGRSELESLCRHYATDADVGAEDLERELGAAVKHLRGLWPGWRR